MAERKRVDPYGFVRLVGKPERREARPHHRFEGLSGRLTCRLTVKTPLFVYNPQFARPVGRGHEEARFPVYEEKAVIPGSSLKGVIRSVAEAVEASCFALFAGPRYRGSGITRGMQLHVELPDGYEHCANRDQLCPACRLFGFLHRGEVHAGKVGISDAIASQGEYELMDFITLDVLSTPKPEARTNAYVIQQGGRNIVRGRKFYRHRLDGVLTRVGGRRDRQNKTVQPAAPGSVFAFEVEYNDLRDEELRLLLYALTLEPGLWHKVGLGKPIGMGSVHLQIVGWRQIDRQRRYRSLGEGWLGSLTDAELKARLGEWVQPYRGSGNANLQDLRELWRYDHDYEVRYQAPSSRWEK